VLKIPFVSSNKDRNWHKNVKSDWYKFLETVMQCTKYVIAVPLIIRSVYSYIKIELLPFWIRNKKVTNILYNLRIKKMCYNWNIKEIDILTDFIKTINYITHQLIILTISHKPIEKRNNKEQLFNYSLVLYFNKQNVVIFWGSRIFAI
jgi:hypothetical protein